MATYVICTYMCTHMPVGIFSGVCCVFLETGLSPASHVLSNGFQQEDSFLSEPQWPGLDHWGLGTHLSEEGQN